MPSEHLPSQSQGTVRPSLGAQRSTSSVHSQSHSQSQSQTDSPSTTPPHHTKPKGPKHVVGGARAHARVPSSKGLHKLTKVHGNEGSHTDLKKLARNSSTSSLTKKSPSAVNLKRNRSSADVPKRPKSSHGNVKRPASVHFEIGDQDDWEEASSSASPALSRTVSRSGVSSLQLSGKSSANNSETHSPSEPHPKILTPSTNGSSENPTTRHTADAKVITDRLLQRTPSHNTTKMSLATATPSTTNHTPESLSQTPGSALTPKIGSGSEVVSRFVGGSGTPSENSPFLQHAKAEPKHATEEVKRAQSMGNLTRRDSDREDGEESALAPRSRKSSTGHAYIPPQQSRTQQKLWLQRASSNIEPQQITPGVAINGIGLGGNPLVGVGYDGRDPRIKLQLDRTGLEYLVVRRYQDPVGAALKRLNQLPGAEKNRRIPYHNAKKVDVALNPTRYGLSQSLKELRGGPNAGTNNGPRSSFEGGQAGSQDDSGLDRDREDDTAGAILRSMWDKSFDFGPSAD